LKLAVKNSTLVAIRFLHSGVRARGTRGEGREDTRIYTYAYTHNFYNKTIARRFGCAACAGPLIGLGYADITYTLRHDAWPKSLVPISPSVYVCVSNDTADFEDGRIGKKETKRKNGRKRNKNNKRINRNWSIAASSATIARVRTRRRRTWQSYLATASQLFKNVSIRTWNNCVRNAPNERSEQSEKKKLIARAIKYRYVDA